MRSRYINYKNVSLEVEEFKCQGKEAFYSVKINPLILMASRPYRSREKAISEAKQYVDENREFLREILGE